MLLIKKYSRTLTLGLSLAVSFSSAIAAPVAPFADDVLKYPHEDVLDFASGSYAGKSLLYTQKNIVKPILDKFAANGFIVAKGDDCVAALDIVAPKVKTGVLKGRTADQIKMIADKLRAMGPISFLDMPARIQEITGARYPDYDLPTYLALVSGGGAALRFAEGDYAYNVNYAIGAPTAAQVRSRAPHPGYDDNATQTGRSFGMGVGTRARERATGPNDVSDQTHLSGLQDLVQNDVGSDGTSKQALEMARTIIQATGNMDFSNFANQSPLAQTLTSDYFAVYTAEQIRNLMDSSLTTQSWDMSLMEVTLLSAYYTNLSEIWVMYQDDYLQIPTTYTNEVYNQYSASTTNAADGSKDVHWKLRGATFADYWQRSTNFKATSKDFRETRSGINITRPEFRLMGQLITKWMAANKPQTVAAVKTLLHSRGDNLYSELSNYFINARAADTLPDTASIATAFVEFQKGVMQNASAIQDSIKAQYPKVRMGRESVINSKVQAARYAARARH